MGLQQDVEGHRDLSVVKPGTEWQRVREQLGEPAWWDTNEAGARGSRATDHGPPIL